MPAAAPPRLRIVERFDSLQGEGALVGVPSRFIRVSGCNLRCVWCDTPESSWQPVGEWMEIDALVAECARGPRHVVVTGGEPLLFEPVVPLIAALRAAGHHLTVESAGTRELPGLACDLLSLSPKLSNSDPHEHPSLLARHQRERFDAARLRRLLDLHPWQIKWVVRAYDPTALAADLAEVDEAMARLELAADPRVFLMPECTDPTRLAADYARLAPECLARGLRLGERLHLACFGHRPGT